MNWNLLESESDLNQINELSFKQAVLIFKHSTRCSISSAALNRIERNWNISDADILKPYYLDLIAYRNISNKIAELFEVEHQSPQVLIIVNGKSVYHESHYGIAYQDIIAKAKQLN
jgi:bacillithiol system protein YtxJ